ncbi:hypothetical protein TSUD_13510 [Trifolium subterraneum]|uniref:Uncharacterized protein n=1 Tax=Trifolium subterraneum TaxID=3900 RepID=A0A2Z6PEL0_TRISU|nr:hypothetical protein TSUD_13510 [Trifolium subterraneum]
MFNLVYEEDVQRVSQIGYVEYALKPRILEISRVPEVKTYNPALGARRFSTGVGFVDEVTMTARNSHTIMISQI